MKCWFISLLICVCAVMKSVCYGTGIIVIGRERDIGSVLVEQERERTDTERGNTGSAANGINPHAGKHTHTDTHFRFTHIAHTLHTCLYSYILTC